VNKKELPERTIGDFKSYLSANACIKYSNRVFTYSFCSISYQKTVGSCFKVTKGILNKTYNVASATMMTALNGIFGISSKMENG